MKICKKCDRELPESSYGKSKDRKDGLTDWCRECRRSYGKEHYRKNRARIIARQMEYHKKHPEVRARYLERTREKRLAKNRLLYKLGKAEFDKEKSGEPQTDK